MRRLRSKTLFQRTKVLRNFHFILTIQGIFSYAESDGPLTQEVEYLPFKQRVVGSSPARPTIENNQIPSTNNQINFNNQYRILDSSIFVCLLEFGHWWLFGYWNLVIGILNEGPHRLVRPRTPAFHVGDRGSNPLGDTSIIIEKPRHRSGLFFFGSLIRPRTSRFWRENTGSTRVFYGI